MRVLLTGSTGMIGKGVLLEMLENDKIEKIILLNRTQTEVKHSKIQEILLSDFTKISHIKSEIGKVDACFHCMGVSAIGLNEEKYSQLTFDISKMLADIVYEINPSAIFNYVSGVGTDSSENGRQMWARVKGKTENYLLNKGFSKAFMFRPGAIIPEKGIQSKTGWYDIIYKVMRPLFPLFLKSESVTTTTRIGNAMIQTLFTGRASGILEPKDINQISKEINQD
ncbi:MAG: SDR family oxidoreductase [Saprospiraceae bacterium]